MEATLYSLDDALSPAANWVLELQDMKESLEEAMGVNITPLTFKLSKIVLKSFCFNSKGQHLKSILFTRHSVSIQHI